MHPHVGSMLGAWVTVALLPVVVRYGRKIADHKSLRYHFDHIERRVKVDVNPDCFFCSPEELRPLVEEFYYL